MKKVLVFIMALVVTLSVSVPVFAAPNGFNVSPGAVIAPELVEYDKLSPECLASLIITAFVDRASLPEEKLAELEKAYNTIVNSDQVAALNAELSALATKLDIDLDNLAVSDLFDISYYNCDDHSGHGGFNLKIKPDTLEGFVGLLHYINGSWELVDNAKITDDGKTLSFTVDTLSPFAIVVETDNGEQPPESGDSFPWLAAMMLLVSGAALTVIVASSKKSKA